MHAPDQTALETGRPAGRSLRVYLTGMLLLVLVPPVLLAVYVGAYTVADEQRDLERGLHVAAQELADGVDHIIQPRQHALELLAESHTASDPQLRSELRARSAVFVTNYGGRLVLVNPGGDVVLDTGAPEGTALAQRMLTGTGSAVAAVQRSARPAVSGVFEVPGAGEPLVAIAVPVMREGRIAAVLAAVQEASVFSRLLAAKAIPPGWNATLRDANGKPIASTASGAPADGARFSSTAQSVAAGWSVNVQAGPQEAAAPLRRAAIDLGSLLLLATAGTLVGGTVVARRLRLAVAALADARVPPPGAARVREIEQARGQLDASRRERKQALAAALAASDALRQTLESMSDGLLAIDREWRFTVVNPAAARMMGHADAAALLGRTVLDALPAIYGKAQFEAAQRALASGAPQSIETFDSLRRRWFELRMFPYSGGLSVYVSDITEQRHAGEALRGAAQRYRLLFEANPTPMWVCDLETLRFLDVNDMALQRYGYSRDEFLAMTVADIRPQGEVGRMQADVDDARGAASESIFDAGVFRHRIKSGRLIEVEVTRSAVIFEGRRAGLVAAVDVTARRAAEREREAAAAQLRAVLARIGDGFIALDAKLCLTYANERAQAVLGAGAVPIGRPFEDWRRAWVDDAALPVLRGALASAEASVVEHSTPGGERWFESRIYPAAEGITVLFTDITEQRRALGALRASEHRYRDLFDLSPHPKFVRDSQTRRFLAANDAALHAYGYSREEMLALRLDDVIPIEDHELLRADLARHGTEPLASEQPGWRRRHKRKDGSLFDVELVSRAIEFEGRAARLVVATVITERLRAEAERDAALAALRQREELLRVFVAEAPVPLAMLDRGLRYIAASRSWNANRGLDDIDLTGCHHREVLPERKPEWNDAEQRGLAGETVRCEADRFERADGRVQWMRWEVLPWTQPASGEVGGILIYAEDITRRVADERALRDAEAYQRGLFEAIGDGVLLLGPELEVLDANPRALVMLGVERGELLAGRLPSYVQGRDHVHISQTLAELAAADTRRPLLAVWEQRRRDGSMFPAEVSARAVDAGHIVVVLRDISERRAAQRALVVHQMELSDLAQRLLSQERETTRRVAQTLHDHLGQELTVARLRLDAALARSEAAMPAALRETCLQVGSALDRAVADVRLVLADLRPPMLGEQGLIAALDNEIRRRTLDASGADVLLEVDDADLALRWPDDVEYAAFMIAREAIVNAQLHAGATLVRVIVEGGADQLRLEVADDGHGIAAAVLGGRPGHLGLVGMRERALAIGARFAVESAPDGGARVVLRWPAEPAAIPGAAAARSA